MCTKAFGRKPCTYASTIITPAFHRSDLKHLLVLGPAVLSAARTVRRCRIPTALPYVSVYRPEPNGRLPDTHASADNSTTHHKIQPRPSTERNMRLLASANKPVDLCDPELILMDRIRNSVHQRYQRTVAEKHQPGSIRRQRHVYRLGQIHSQQLHGRSVAPVQLPDPRPILPDHRVSLC